MTRSARLHFLAVDYQVVIFEGHYDGESRESQNERR